MSELAPHYDTDEEVSHGGAVIDLSAMHALADQVMAVRLFEGNIISELGMIVYLHIVRCTGTT